jgi:hypothetical protein
MEASGIRISLIRSDAHIGIRNSASDTQLSTVTTFGHREGAPMSAYPEDLETPDQNVTKSDVNREAR